VRRCLLSLLAHGVPRNRAKTNDLMPGQDRVAVCFRRGLKAFLFGRVKREFGFAKKEIEINYPSPIIPWTNCY
jgi:hypothetical protein